MTDYCLRAGQLGYGVVYTPWAELKSVQKFRKTDSAGEAGRRTVPERVDRVPADRGYCFIRRICRWADRIFAIPVLMKNTGKDKGNSSMKKAAVIIPNYNGAAYLEPCLDSLMRQSEKSFSVIVVDNGSTDGSRERYGKNIPGHSFSSGGKYGILRGGKPGNPGGRRTVCNTAEQ